MRIGELAKQAGVSVRSLRYYEEQGLLASERSSSGQRRYPDESVQRVMFLQRLYAAGLSSRTIAEVLPCVDSPSPDTSDDAFERMVAVRNRLDAHIDELLATREALDQLIGVNRRYRATQTPLPATGA
ncbi:MerR family transcriptional regulator [Actinocorallia aurea]